MASLGTPERLELSWVTLCFPQHHCLRVQVLLDISIQAYSFHQSQLQHMAFSEGGMFNQGASVLQESEKETKGSKRREERECSFIHVMTHFKEWLLRKHCKGVVLLGSSRRSSNDAKEEAKIEREEEGEQNGNTTPQLLAIWSMWCPDDYEEVDQTQGEQSQLSVAKLRILFANFLQEHPFDRGVILRTNATIVAPSGVGLQQRENSTTPFSTKENEPTDEEKETDNQVNSNSKNAKEIPHDVISIAFSGEILLRECCSLSNNEHQENGEEGKGERGIVKNIIELPSCFSHVLFSSIHLQEGIDEDHVETDEEALNVSFCRVEGMHAASIALTKKPRRLRLCLPQQVERCAEIFRDFFGNPNFWETSARAFIENRHEDIKGNLQEPVAEQIPATTMASSPFQTQDSLITTVNHVNNLLGTFFQKIAPFILLQPLPGRMSSHPPITSSQLLFSSSSSEENEIPEEDGSVIYDDRRSSSTGLGICSTAEPQKHFAPRQHAIMKIDNLKHRRPAVESGTEKGGAAKFFSMPEKEEKEDVFIRDKKKRKNVVLADIDMQSKSTIKKPSSPGAPSPVSVKPMKVPPSSSSSSTRLSQKMTELSRIDGKTQDDGGKMQQEQKQELPSGQRHRMKISQLEEKSKKISRPEFGGDEKKMSGEQQELIYPIEEDIVAPTISVIPHDEELQSLSSEMSGSEESAVPVTTEPLLTTEELEAKRQKAEEEEKTDEMFADLETVVKYIGRVLFQSTRCCQENSGGSFVKMAKCFLRWIFSFFSVLLAAIIILFIVLPTFFAVLIVRMVKVEISKESFVKRARMISAETVAKHTLRLARLFLRSLPLSLFLVIIPVIIFNVVIPSTINPNDRKGFANITGNQNQSNTTANMLMVSSSSLTLSTALNLRRQFPVENCTVSLFPSSSSSSYLLCLLLRNLTISRQPQHVVVSQKARQVGFAFIVIFVFVIVVIQIQGTTRATLTFQESAKAKEKTKSNAANVIINWWRKELKQQQKRRRKAIGGKPKAGGRNNKHGRKRETIESLSHNALMATTLILGASSVSHALSPSEVETGVALRSDFTSEIIEEIAAGAPPEAIFPENVITEFHAPRFIYPDELLLPSPNCSCCCPACSLKCDQCDSLFSLQNIPVLLGVTVESLQLSCWGFNIMAFNRNFLPNWKNWNFVDTDLLPSFYFQLPKDPFFFVFWLSVSIIWALILLIVGRMEYEMLHYESMKNKKESEKHKNENEFAATAVDRDFQFQHEAVQEELLEDPDDFFFHSFTGSILYGHGDPKNIPSWMSGLVQVVCDVLFFILVSSISIPLTCFRDGEIYFYSNGQVSQIADHESSGKVCWSSAHQAFCIVALMTFGYFVPLSIMVAPVISEANKSNKPGAISISKPYTMIVNCLKVFCVMVTVVASMRPAPSILIAFLLCITLAIMTYCWSRYTNFERGPASRQAVNIVRFCCLVGATVCAGVALLFFWLEDPLQTSRGWGIAKYLVIIFVLLVCNLGIPILAYAGCL